ncbi:MAG: hypothetical protein LPK09_14420 [Hymenobacteraceae bacterium]|nr:hypothetical protein [Hymenobacteraceae bacterium]
MSDNKRNNNPDQDNNKRDVKHEKEALNQQKSPQGSNANLSTASRGADSTDKEFRNNQPNASTVTDPDMKSKERNN